MYMMDFSKPPHASETETHSQRHQEREQELISGGGKGIWWEISNWLILGGILVVFFLLFKYVF